MTKTWPVMAWLALICALLQACAVTVGPGTGGAAGPARAASGAAARPVKPATAANPLKGTELDGIFTRIPITSSNRPEQWPRVALTIKKATAGVHGYANVKPVAPNDCILFDIQLWRSATDGKKFENLQLCTPGVEQLSRGKAYRSVELLGTMRTNSGGDTTANRRTEGPVPPFYVFPQDIKSQHEWSMGMTNGLYFMGALFVALGWDWDNDFDRRLWVVSVPLAQR